MAVGIPAADREWDRTTITRTKERVKNLRHVSDEERAQIQSSATRAALAVELELGRAKSPYADHWPYVLSVAAGLVLTAAGLIAAMHADLNLVNGPAFLVPGSIEGEVSVLAPVPLPITPSQIAVVVAVSAFVAGASYWAAWREDHAPLLPYFTTLPLLFGAYILGGGIPLVTDSVITSFIGSINWLLYLTGALLPTFVGMAGIASLSFFRALGAIRQGGPGRPVDHLTLEMLDWVEELDRNADCWRTPAKRRHLVNRYSRGVEAVESRLRREMHLLYGRATVSRLGLGTKPHLVGARLREHTRAVALMALPRHVGELRAQLERTLWAAAVGDWESFESAVVIRHEQAWWRRHARNLGLGTVIVALGLWAPQEWLESAGLGTQRSALLLVGAGILVSVDPLSRFRELIPTKGG